MNHLTKPMTDRAQQITSDNSSHGWPKVLAVGAVLGAGLALANRAFAARSERRHPPIGEFVTVDGVRLHHLVRGEGPPIVLLHGNGTLIEDWIASGLFDELAKDHRVIAFDRPGFGHSERPGDRVWTPQEQARVLAKAIRALGIEKPVVVGHSFGTMVTMALALDHPELVSRIVLLSGYYFPNRRIDAALFGAPAIPVVGDAMRYTISPWISRAMAPLISRQLFAPAPVPPAWKHRFPMEQVHRPAQIKGIAADSGLMVPAAESMCGRYGELGMPVTIVSGDGDKIVNPEEQSERLHRELPHSRLLMLPGLGHMVHYLATDRLAGAIRQAGS